jgi:hypothetical protein
VDPCPSFTHPGWPLRNYLALLALHFRARDVSIIAYRPGAEADTAERAMLIQLSLSVAGKGNFRIRLHQGFHIFSVSFQRKLVPTNLVLYPFSPRQFFCSRHKYSGLGAEPKGMVLKSQKPLRSLHKTKMIITHNIG